MAARGAVGLDIGTSGVRAAELTLGKGAATLERFGQVALPVGAVRDGEVVDVDAVSSAIRQLWSQAKFTSKKVVVGVANQKVVVRQVDLPWLPEKELRRSLQFQVADVIPMPIDQAVLDYHPLEEYANSDGGRMLRVLLVAASRDMVSSSIAAVTKAGLEPVMVDLTPFAVLRSLGATDHLGLSGEAEALVDVGASVTNIIVHQGGIPRFVRILLMGGGDVTDAMAERMGVSFDDAESVKHTMALAHDSAQVDQHPASRVLESAGAQWVDEVRGSLDYYAAQVGSLRLRQIVLSGGGGRLGGLAARLATAARVAVVPAAPMASLRVGKTGLSQEQLSYIEPLIAVPVGLALGRAS